MDSLVCGSGNDMADGGPDVDGASEDRESADGAP